MNAADVEVAKKSRLIGLCDAGRSVREAQQALADEFGESGFTDEQVAYAFRYLTNFRRTGGAFGKPNPEYRKGLD